MQLILLGTAILVLAGCQRPDDKMADGSAQTADSAEGMMQTDGEMPADGIIVAQGRFVGKGGQTTVGGYRIESADGDIRLVLGGDFRTDEGPDLHVVLSPLPVDEVEGGNATSDDATLIVAPLNGFEGPQEFDLPDDLDFSGYHSVLIHCIEFSHLYGAATVAGR